MRFSFCAVALLATQGLTLSLPEAQTVKGQIPTALVEAGVHARGKPVTSPNHFTITAKDDDGHLDKRFSLLEFAGAFLRATAAAVFPVQVGVYTWSGAIWSTAKKCFESTFDCLFGIADAVFGVWRTAFVPAATKRDVNGHLVYASTAVDRNDVHWNFHVPFDNHTRLIHVLRNNFKYDGNHTFTHVATVYRKGLHTHSLYHRFAHPEDLGHENDGSFHQIRALPSTASNITKRVEKDIDHVVGDYIWKDGNSQFFNDIHNEKNLANDIGSTIANWMEENNSQATCASIRTWIPVSEGSSVPEYENQGVFAYGSNDKPFDFKGRSGSWIDQCR